MGMLSEFVIAQPDVAVEIGQSNRPSEQWNTLEGWKGIETIKLTTLYCSMTGVEYSTELMSSFKLLGGNKEEGPWVFIFPQNVTDALAALKEERYSEVAEKYHATLDGFPPFLTRNDGAFTNW